MPDKLFVRIGDAGEYEEVGFTVVDLAEHFDNCGVEGTFYFFNQYGLETAEYRGQNYISVYFGTDFETPTRGLSAEELEELNSRI